ncbi:MAG: twin-arginine translocase TatA/TatE family subunit [Gemmatimonadota bacterium]|nr:twin-arginine translocase TatA/TatE family subunit [Gemmatimonadota bacterium]
MGFGSLGISELLVIFVIVLVFFGPRRMPEIARSLGSAMREFRRSLNQIQREFEEADPTRPPRADRSVLERMPDAVRPREPPGRPPSPSPGPDATPPGPDATPPGPDANPAEPPADAARPDAAPTDSGEPEDPGPPPAREGDRGSG